MWTPATRRQHSREGLRYATDLTDAEWALIEPHMPKPRIRGRPREWPLREVLNAIFYVLRGGVAWRLLPRRGLGDLRRWRRSIGSNMSVLPHIFVVDDEPAAREMVGDYLKLHGFKVTLCEGGASLRQAIAKDKPALIVLDLNMPEEDGLSI